MNTLLTESSAALNQIRREQSRASTTYHRRRAIMVVVLLMFGVAVIQSWTLVHQVPWYDEACTWRDAGKPIQTIMHWRQNGGHAPLSYLLAKVATRMFHTDAAWAMRLPSFLAALACLPIALWFGIELGSTGLGLGFAFLLAADPLMRSQSIQARMYTLLALATLLCLAMLARIMRKKSVGPLSWCLWGLVIGLAFWASMAGLMVWAAIAICVTGWFAWQTFKQRTIRTIRAWLPGMATAAIVALAVSQIGFVHLQFDGRFLRNLAGSQSAITDAAAHNLSGAIGGCVRALGDMFGSPWLAWPLLLVAVFGWAVALRRRNLAVVALIVAAGLNLLMAVRLQYIFWHWMTPRYLMIFNVAVCFGLVEAVVFFARGSRPLVGVAGLAALVFVLSFSSIRSKGITQGYVISRVIENLSHNVRPGDTVVYGPEWIHLLGYYYGMPRSPEAEAWLIESKPTAPPPTSLTGASRVLFIVGHRRGNDAVVIDHVRRNLNALFGEGSAQAIDVGADETDASAWWYEPGGGKQPGDGHAER